MQKANDPIVDFFARAESIDAKRRNNDIMLQLLTSDDKTELERHILGIVASSAENTETKQQGLLYQLFAVHLNEMQQTALQRIEQLVTQDETISTRVQYHFILFIALATSNEFVKYILDKSRDAMSVKFYIEEVLQERVSQLMYEIEHMFQQDKPQFENILSDFVERCRTDYMCYCMSGAYV